MTRTFAQSASATQQRVIPASVSLRTLTALLVALFAFDNVLLLGFVGLPPLLVAGLSVILPPLLALLVWKTMADELRVSISTVLLCLVASTILLVLGGEGRLLNATADWQIRDAVLADMGNHHWPFDYWLEGKTQMLRAPIGMYLVPALLGGARQIGRDWALLAHNSFILGLLLAQITALFEGRRARLIALTIFVAFSGLDIVGNLIRLVHSAEVDWNHLERWAGYYQYSSHITQIFWVPQHGFAGWTVALTYLLWRKNQAPVGIFAASLPLVALWSPLILFGALPFALFAGFCVLRSGEWNWLDILLCLIGAAISLPALLYLSSGATDVGSGLRPAVLGPYILILLLEVAPFLVPLLRDRSGKSDRPTLIIVALCLLLMPLWSIGASNDFQMRASIMPLALLALAFADWAVRLERWDAKACLVAIVALGSVTGTVEIARAIRFAPSPAPHCSLQGVWYRQTGFAAPYASYFAARDTFPVKVTPAERVSVANPATCWDHPWDMPRRNAAMQETHP